MEEEIKCPQCGGSKFRECENDTYKCMYCGTIFSVKKSDKEEDDDYEDKVTENVNRSGGCLSISTIAIIVIFIFFLFLITGFIKILSSAF